MNKDFPYDLRSKSNSRHTTHLFALNDNLKSLSLLNNNTERMHHVQEHQFMLFIPKTNLWY